MRLLNLQVSAPSAKELMQSAAHSVWHQPVNLLTNRYRPTERVVTALHVVGLSLLGLVFYNKWLTVTPLSSGDWVWEPSTRLNTWWPWPSVWDPSVGLGLKNFGQSFEFPLFAAAGLLTHLGLSWGLVEKLLYFWPFAALSLVAPWVLAREILGKSRWALVAALIFATNTAMLQVSTVGHFFLAMAAVIAPLVFASFIRSLRSLSLPWALVTGLLLALQSAYEFRIMYLTVLACIAYMIALAAAQPSWKRIKSRALLTLASLLVLAGCESYWALPLFTYHGDYGLNLPATPWVAFMSLAHGLAAVDPYWTWGPPSWFQTVQFNPVFFVVPLLAFLAILGRRVKAEMLWLSLVALGSAFLIKQTNPPLGEVYDWMFQHVPGWNMFREASKLYFLVAVAYAILIAFWLKSITAVETGSRVARRLKVVTAAVVTLIVGGLGAACIVPLATGQLGSTTRPTNEPASLAAFRTILEHDPSRGSVLWFGGPWAQARPGVPDLTVPDRLPLLHEFAPWSQIHPIVELVGTRDPLSVFCQDPSAPFCYFRDQTFDYLAQRVGARYIVSPTGPNVGAIPAGTTSEELVNRLTSLFGPAQRLGAPDDGLAFWRLPGDGSPVVQAPAIAVVAGPESATPAALPALTALAIPAIYQTGAPQAPSAAVDRTVDVIPDVSGVYQLQSPGLFYAMARSVAPKLTVVDGAHQTPLQAAASSRHLPGWGMYGPLTLDAGRHVLSASGGLTLGPLIRQSPLATSILAGYESSQGLAITSSNAESVAASSNPKGPAWFELRTTVDGGWRTTNALSHLPGDSLFNLFFVADTHAQQVFSFSTGAWERLGIGIALLWTVSIGFLALILARRQPATLSTPPLAEPRNGIVARTAQSLAISGVALLVIAAASYTLGWFGVLQLDTVFYLAVAIGALAVSCVLNLVSLGIPEPTYGKQFGSPQIAKIIELLVKVGLWKEAQRASVQVLRWTGIAARRRIKAEAFYRQFIREGDLCFDVGANIGKRTAVFLALGAKVVAIEPQPECVETLKEEFGENARVVVVAKALGGHPGVGELMISPANALSSMSEDWLRTVKASGRFSAFQELSWKESKVVPLTTLDEMVQEFGPPAFCKIDVEGYEAEVLRGLSRPIRVLSFEFAPEFIRGTRECLRILSGLGPCEFNYSVGESMRLELSGWVNAVELERILTTLRDNRIFGDVYVRFLELGFFR